MPKILRLIALVIAMTFSLNSALASAESISTKKAVLITGASTGIGRLAAEQLAAESYFVYAGARKASDIEALNNIENIKAVRLDVTIQEEIDAAVKLVKSEGRGLWGIVNNAGINIIDPLIEAKTSDMQFLFDVNVFGVFRVTKAFAPLVIESKGRIVNISSISGVLAGGLPGYGMYAMSKHAIEAYTDQLISEMANLGVKVSAVEPGNFRSEIGLSRCKRMIAEGSSREYKYFGDVMENHLESCKEYVAEGINSSAPPPNLVADAIQHALFDDAPKEHYLVTSNPFEAMITTSISLRKTLNLNHDHQFSYKREQLIKLMDDEWAILKGEKTRDWGN